MQKKKSAETQLAQALLREQRARIRNTKYFYAIVLGYLAGTTIGHLLNPELTTSFGVKGSGIGWIGEGWSLAGGVVGTIFAVVAIKLYFRIQDAR
jgi:hypothetical protein